MRETTVRGIDDGVRLDLGSDVGIVAAVIEVADAADGLIYKRRSIPLYIPSLFTRRSSFITGTPHPPRRLGTFPSRGRQAQARHERNVIKLRK